jgi:hypothetical protein
MEIDKQEIVQFLRDQGKHDQASQAEKELPDKVDHEQHKGLLDRFEVDAKQLLGGKGIPGF